MRCKLSSVVVFAMCVTVFAPDGQAGMPRGATLSADEQDADAATGITLARGNAEIRIDDYRIVGRADLIELNPVLKTVVFSGHAVITVREERYESDRVRCAIDFNSCAVVTDSDAVPSNAGAAAQPGLVTAPQSGPMLPGAATTNP